MQQNIEQLQTHTMGVTINKKSTTTEPPPLNGQQSKPRGGGGGDGVGVGVGGGLNEFYWHQIFVPDSAVVEVQKMFSSHVFIMKMKYINMSFKRYCTTLGSAL